MVEPQPIPKKNRNDPNSPFHYTIDIEGRILAANNSLLKLLQFQEEELIDLSFYQLISATDYSNFSRELNHAIKSNKSKIHSRLFLHKKNGDKVYLSQVLSFQKKHNLPTIVQITALEIKSEMSFASKRRATKNLYESIFESNSVASIIEDRNSNLYRCNRAFSVLIGQLPSPIEELHITKLFESILRDSYPDLSEPYLETKYLFYLKDGRAIEVQRTNINESHALWNFTEVINTDLPEQDTQQKTNWYKHIFENNPTMYFVLDHNGIVQSVNTFGANTLGYAKEELEGNPVINVFHPDDRPEVKNKFQKALKANTSLHEWEFRKLRKDGSCIWVHEWVSVVSNNDNICVFVVCEDITKRKKAENTLVQHKIDLEKSVIERTKELQTSNDELAEFVYMASHDLKTPLRAISSLVTWLAQDYSDKFDHKGKAQIKLLIDRTRRMHHFLDGIIAYSQIGKREIFKKKTDLQDIISQIKLNTNILHPDVKILIDNRLEEIALHKAKIEQVFTNLIENAIRHNDKPKPVINIGSYLIQGKTTYYVRDNGPGIAKRHEKKVFKMFQTLDPRDEKESIGIGLSIVKKIIESNNGKIWLESENGTGSTFLFTLK